MAKLSYYTIPNIFCNSSLLVIQHISERHNLTTAAQLVGIVVTVGRGTNVPLDDGSLYLIRPPAFDS